MERPDTEDLIAVISNAVADAYARKMHPGPSIQDFRVHLTGSLSSRWNKKAAEIFAEDFLALGWAECRDKNAIRRVFMVHLINLRKQYRKTLGPLTQQELDREKKILRDNRRREVSSQCLGSIRL